MTKCTLCADRIHDENLSERDRKPACVLACPTSARLFGDIHDPESVVSKAIRERGGYQLMPEWETKPSNHYLPRQKTAACGSGSCACADTAPQMQTETSQDIAAQVERGQLNLASIATKIRVLTDKFAIKRMAK
jgi:ferredoxin